MENPFEKRAHEHLRDTEAFLSIVSPDPAHYYLEKPAQDGRLFDRLVIMLGTPGSGKTTLAKLFEYASLDAVTRRQDDVYKSLATALRACRARTAARPAASGSYPDPGRGRCCRLVLAFPALSMVLRRPRRAGCPGHPAQRPLYPRPLR